MVTPCEVLKIEKSLTQTLVVLKLGETNRDDGDNSCTAQITSGKKIALIRIGYYIND